MNRFYTTMLLLIGLLSLIVQPNIAVAAPSNTMTATDGIEFRIAHVNGNYEVYMRPNVDATGPAITLTAQVTIKVPHGVDANRFLITGLTNAVAGTEWTETSRVDAPVEDRNADYISLTVAFPSGNHQAFPWVAGEEVKVFSFANQGSCLGAVSLLSNDDAFVPDLALGKRNSANTNPGNQIDVLNLGEGNLFAGIYGGAASCETRAIELNNHLYLPIISGN
ncbi:MAG: hypothetical protein KDE58_31705 [Caldilineaceae bacterium]|nr:hypothetical protein [Caldilineaceae bacterium]